MIFDKRNARPIRGNDGVGVYLHERGYVVEHFTLSGPTTRVIFRSSPFATRGEADEYAAEYRKAAEDAQYRSA